MQQPNQCTDKMKIGGTAMPESASLGAEDILWQAVLQRDPNFEELILYGVRSTKIYCRPTCPSRKPNRHQVYFFDSAQAAEAAGYRPCKRCAPQHAIAPNSSIAKVLVICRYLDVQVEHIPTGTPMAKKARSFHP